MYYMLLFSPAVWHSSDQGAGAERQIFGAPRRVYMAGYGRLWNLSDFFINWGACNWHELLLHLKLYTHSLL